MEMPDNVKHIQLALLANSDDSNEASREEFHKILTSLPLEMVGNVVIEISFDFCLIRSAPKGRSKADVEQFCKMLYKTASYTSFQICCHSGDISDFIFTN